MASERLERALDAVSGRISGIEADVDEHWVSIPYAVFIQGLPALRLGEFFLSRLVRARKDS